MADNFANQIKKVVDKVEFILSTVPESRNSDITLCIEVWKRYHQERIYISERTGKAYMELEALFDLPREDHIKRIRTKIQNEEKRYLPTNKQVLIERAKLSDAWKAALGYHGYWTDADWSNAIDNYLKPNQSSLL